MNFPHPLFSTPDAFVLRGLAALNRAVDEVMPLTAARRRDLPNACRELSAMLTSDRNALERPYWTLPRFTSAYLRYFLPWNLIRLTALLPGLDLGTAHGSEGGIPPEPLILDLGSGPCTLPLALWLSRPDLRWLPVTVVASDTAPHPMDLGRRMFDILRDELDPASPWSIRTLRAPAHAAIRLVRGRPWLITMGNVLNELEERDRRPGLLLDRLESLLDDAARALPPDGRLLAVEPGTRQGGRLVTMLRGLALNDGRNAERGEDEEDEAEEDAWRAAGVPSRSGASDCEEDEEGSETDGTSAEAPRFAPLAPCPHAGRCPMTARGVTAWCHVNAPATSAPAPLRELSRLAGLNKESVSLAFLLLARPRDAADGAERKNGEPSRPVIPSVHGSRSLARLISDPFVLPGYPGRARYACTELGLALIPDSAFLAPGALCEVTPTPRRDGKSGARIMTLPGRDTPPSLPLPTRLNAARKPSGETSSLSRHASAKPRGEGDARKEQNASRPSSDPDPKAAHNAESPPRRNSEKNARPQHKGTGRKGADRKRSNHTRRERKGGGRT